MIKRVGAAQIQKAAELLQIDETQLQKDHQQRPLLAMLQLLGQAQLRTVDDARLQEIFLKGWGGNGI
jgi:hypothetical protein